MLMYVGTSAWGIPLPSCAGEGMEKIQNDTVLFRFVPGKRMFWADYRGNRQSIERLQTLIREHKDAIFSGSGSNVNRCILQVYRDGQAYGQQQVSAMTNKEATFNLRLVSSQEYDFVFWAECATAAGSGPLML